MEEKINNKRIFSYVPSLIAKIILDSNLKDEDVFFRQKNSNNLNKTLKTNHENNKPIAYVRYSSVLSNPEVFPIEYTLENTIVMDAKLIGFDELITSLTIQDKTNKKEKTYCEYLSILTSKILLQITSIISENGGEIIKYNDFEFSAVWDISYLNTIRNSLEKYIYLNFYAKHAIVSAIEIMKKIDNTEIVKNFKLKISIGISYGESSIIFFGGERRRSEYILMGEAIEMAETCLKHCLPHDIIIGREIYNFFRGKNELVTEQIKTDDDTTNVYKLIIEECDEYELKNFHNFNKNLKLKNNYISMNRNVYENLAKKVYILSSILPAGLIKYLDIGEDTNLKEISILTIMTIHVSLDLDIIDNNTKIQNLIHDLQRATYLTRGSLLYITKTFDGLLIRCVWGLEPSTFIDECARAISTAFVIKKLINYYNINIAIGISTGCCFTGLITIQGNRKQYTLLGFRTIISRLLADKALNYISINNNNNNKNNLKKFIIYCDKNTVKFSQKWIRYNYVNDLKVVLDNFAMNNDQIENINSSKSINKNNNKSKNSSPKKEKQSKDLITLKQVIENQPDVKQQINLRKKKSKLLNQIKIEEIYTPIENEESFFQTYLDPFPFIRTHKYNTHNNKINKNNKYNSHKIENLFEVNSNFSDEEENNKISTIKKAMKDADFLNTEYDSNHISKSIDNKISNDKFLEGKAILKLKKSQNIFGFSKRIKIIIKLFNNTLINNSQKIILIKGVLGVGKSLFIRKALNNFIGLNENLANKYFCQKCNFLFCNIMNPLRELLPYNSFTLILRNIYISFHREKMFDKIYKMLKKIPLTDIDILNKISFILSNGNDDINIINEVKYFKQKCKKGENYNENIYEELNKNKKYDLNSAKYICFSIVKELEGPFNYQEIENKINKFFYELLKLYFLTFLKIYNLPLILLLDDIHLTDKFSINFINYLIENNDVIKPFMLILIQQTSYVNNIHKTNINLNLTEFLDKNINKIKTFRISPIHSKKILEKIIITTFKESVAREYNMKLKVVDNKLLDYLLMKSFYGVPLLVINLLKSLINSEKFIQSLSGEYIITSELKDEFDIFDWSGIILPYIYEKITSISINKILNFKEILTLRYASILGNIFDIQSLVKINPLSSIIKIEDVYNMIIKLNNEYFIELYNDIQTKKNKLICQLTFPLLRESLYQKFLFETRAVLHMKSAGVISSSNRAKYFSFNNEIKMLKRHLINGEKNIINEIESKEIKTNKDILQTKKVLSYCSLKILLIKEISHNFLIGFLHKLLDGNLEMYIDYTWRRIYYIFTVKNILCFNQDDEFKETKTPKMIINLNNIFKSNISLYSPDKCKNNVLEIAVNENGRKKNYFFASEGRQNIYKIEIAINFLRMKVNYDNFVSNFGMVCFPLYKIKIFRRMEKYYMNLDNIKIYIFKHYSSQKLKYSNSFNSGYENVLEKSKNFQKPFSYLIKSVPSLILGMIQENISKFKGNSFTNQEKNDSQLIIRNINHLNKPLQKLFERLKNIEDQKKLELNNRKYSGDSSNISSDEISEKKKKRRIVKIKNNYSSDSLPPEESDEKSINNSKNNKNESSDDEDSLYLDIRSCGGSKIDSLKSGLVGKKFVNFPINDDIDCNNEIKNVIFDSNSSKNNEMVEKKSRNVKKKKVIGNDKKDEKLKIFTNKTLTNTNKKINISKFINTPKVLQNDKYNKNSIESEEEQEEIIISDSGRNNYKNSLSNNNNNNNLEYLLTQIETQSYENKKKNFKSRNKPNHQIKSKSLDGNITNNYGKKKIKLSTVSMDSNYKLPGDFVPVKNYDKFINKHVNIISSETESISSKENVILYKWDNNRIESKKTKKIYDECKYFYIDNNNISSNRKIHKCNIFSLGKKMKNK